MSEREFGHTQRDLIVTFGDGTRTYAARIPQSGIKWKKAQFAPIWAQDSDSSYFDDPRAGPLTAPAELMITGPFRLYDPGKNTTEAVMQDLIEVEGYVSSTWTTTGTAGTGYRSLTVTVALAKIGSSPGGSWVWTKAIIANQPEYSVTPEGLFVDQIQMQCGSNPELTRVT